jgi:MYXO-CTERM domain-containing protein
MRRGLAFLFVPVALLLAPRPAAAFCRITTTETKVDGPDVTACYDTSDPPVWWPGACIGLSVQKDGSPRYGITASQVESLLFDTVLPNWMNAACPASGHPSIEIANTGEVACDVHQANLYGPNANVVMFHDDAWPYDDCEDCTSCDSSPECVACQSVIALTTVTFHPETGALWDADIEVNSACHPLSTTLPVPAGSYDLQSILQHETGHYLGLAHPPDPSAIMYYLYTPGNDGKRVLNVDDIDGICTIYTPAGDRTVGAEVADGGLVAEGTCDAVPRNGFGSACVSDAGNQPPPTESGSCRLGKTQAPPTLPTWLTVAGAVGLLARRRRRATT